MVQHAVIKCICMVFSRPVKRLLSVGHFADSHTFDVIWAWIQAKKALRSSMQSSPCLPSGAVKQIIYAFFLAMLSVSGRQCFFSTSAQKLTSHPHCMCAHHRDTNSSVYVLLRQVSRRHAVFLSQEVRACASRENSCPSYHHGEY